jgi:hypothetical protein
MFGVGFGFGAGAGRDDAGRAVGVVMVRGDDVGVWSNVVSVSNREGSVGCSRRVGGAILR